MIKLFKEEQKKLVTIEDQENIFEKRNWDAKIKKKNTRFVFFMIKNIQDLNIF